MPKAKANMEKLTPKEMFENHFKIGPLTDGYFEFDVYHLNHKKLTARARSTKDQDGFKAGEKVYFQHIDTNLWRVTSKRNDHGHAVFILESVGLSIGS
jgi:hypothetical protein